MELGRRGGPWNWAVGSARPIPAAASSVLRERGTDSRLSGSSRIQAVTVKYSARQYSTFGRSVYISLLSDGIEIIVILFCWRTFGSRTNVAITTLLVDKPAILPPLVELMW